MKTIHAPILAILTLTACADTEPSSNSEAITTACAESPAGRVTVVDSWVRAAPEGRPMSAAYLTLCNRTDASMALIGVETAIAEAAELHETTRDRDGVASMAPVERIAIAPGDSAALEPGGPHIMLIGVTDPIAEGDTVELTLQFEAAPPIVLNVKARGDGATANEHKGH